MNVLFLSNPARGYHRFFNALARQFSDTGHSVAFAADCRFAAKANGLFQLGLPVHIFEDFFREHTTNKELLRSYSDCNLNAMLLADFERGQVFNYWGRLPPEHYDQMKSALLSFFRNLIETLALDAIIFENVAGALSHFALAVCERSSCRYVGITSTRLPGRFTLTSDPFAEAETISRKLEQMELGQVEVDEKVKAWSFDYLSKIERIEPDYMAFNGLESLRLTSREPLAIRLKMWTDASRFAFRDPTFAYGIGNPFKHKLSVMCRTLGRNLRARRLARYYSPSEEGEKFLLYPLHYHPEASTSVLAGAYLNEYEVIRNIAFNLPEGVRLYVKDHRSAFGFPSLEFYEALSRLPNVRIIEPFADTKRLIKESLAVITLTSTVGYEALLMGKRVFLFGRVFYERHPDVVRIVDPSDLHQTLTRFQNMPVQSDEDFNARFIQAYYLSSHAGYLNLSGSSAADLASELFPTIAAHVYGVLEN